jgi:hypothetical protein
MPGEIHEERLLHQHLPEPLEVDTVAAVSWLDTDVEQERVAFDAQASRAHAQFRARSDQHPAPR